MLLEAPETLDSTEAIVIPMEEAADQMVNESPVDETQPNEPEQIEGSQEMQEEPSGEQTAEVQTPEISDEDKRFWAKCDVMAKIADCNRGIKESEEVIAEMKDAIKDEKDLLKGNQIRLQRLASELADIIEGRPLPKNPNAKSDKGEKPTEQPTSGDGQSADPDEYAWRDKPTGELLDGVKGLGAKKLEAIVDLAPTAGHLEDLRGEASKAHLPFKDKLPKGCGQNLADELENRLVDLVASCAKSAEEQAAEERAKEAEDIKINFDAITIEIRERLEIERKDAKSGDEFRPSDIDDFDDPLVDGWHTFMNGEPINAVADAELVRTESDARNWLYGWLSARMVHNWEEKPVSQG